MNQKNLDLQKPPSTRQIFALLLKSILSSFMKSRDSGDRTEELNLRLPASCTPIDSSQCSGQPRTNVGYLNTLTGKINWGAAHELGPGLRKWFPVLTQAVDDSRSERIVNVLISGGILVCILLFYVFWR